MADVHDLERLWKQRWEVAKRKLELAAIHVHHIEQLSRPKEAYREALEAEIHAAAEYTEVLRAYTDLVVYGKTPDEGRWLRRQTARASRKNSKS
jgi:hypothetical protein